MIPLLLALALQVPCTGGGPEHIKNLPPDCIPAAQYFTQYPTGTLPQQDPILQLACSGMEPATRKKMRECDGVPKPLTCGKYQHVEYEIEGDVITIPENRHPWHNVPGSEHCVDTLHTVSEREWQQWMYVQKTQQEVNKALKDYIIENEAQLRRMKRQIEKLAHK